MKLKLREKKVNVFGKSIPVIAVVAVVLMAGIAGAALVDYLSNTLTTEATVKSPMELKGELTYWSAEKGFFTKANGGTANWSSERSCGDGYSVKLGVPAYNSEEYNAGEYDEARVVFSYDDTLDSISGVSFMSYVEGGYSGRLHPYVVLAVDTGGDGAPDAWVVQCLFFPEGNELEDDWREISFNGESPVHVAGERPGLPTETGVDGHYRPYTTNHNDDDTLNALKAEDGWGAFTVVEVKVMIGVFPTDEMTAYIDDITGDVGSDFEPVRDAFVGEPSVPLCGGDEFYMDLKAKNLANTPIEAAYRCKFSGTDIGTGDFAFESVDGTAWTVPTIDVEGNLTTTTVTPTIINPMGTNAIYVKVKANPLLAEGNYTFDVQVVPQAVQPP